MSAPLLLSPYKVWATPRLSLLFFLLIYSTSHFSSSRDTIHWSYSAFGRSPICFRPVSYLLSTGLLSTFGRSSIKKSTLSTFGRSSVYFRPVFYQATYLSAGLLSPICFRPVFCLPSAGLQSTFGRSSVKKSTFSTLPSVQNVGSPECDPQRPRRVPPAVSKIWTITTVSNELCFRPRACFCNYSEHSISASMGIGFEVTNCWLSP